MKPNKKISLLALCVTSFLSLPAGAAVSPAEAERLKNDLTPMGAIKAGNADGSIPAWTGGMTEAVASSNPKRPPQLFAGEKPLVSISKDNLGEFAGKLTQGTQHLLQHYPGYRVDVYPTHRTGAAPQFIYDRTLANATQMTLNDSVMSFDKYNGGIPFPIPQSGEEVIFNMQWNWRAVDSTLKADTWFVSSSGKRAITSGNIVNVSSAWNYPDGRENKFDKKLWGATMVTATAPAYSAGEKQMIHAPRDMINMPTNAWAYLTGQRRLRKAPNVQYDVPNNFTSGLTNFDDSWGFNGAPDRYDWKLLGREEFYVPYHGNAMANAKASELIGEKFLNPDLMRWELHRVWVVEATLKSGSRHVVPKRRLYIDEDTWTILVSDMWDAKGQLWKTMQLPPLTFPDVPVSLTVPLAIYNFQAGDYAVMSAINDSGEVSFDELSATMYTPQHLERSGVR